MKLSEFLKNFKLKEKHIISYSGDNAIKKVKEDGLALKWVKEQTPEICLESVKEHGDALQWVKEQTSDICLEAVKKDGLALQYVKEQTPEICIEAVKKDGDALQYVDKNVFEKEDQKKHDSHWLSLSRLKNPRQRH